MEDQPSNEILKAMSREVGSGAGQGMEPKDLTPDQLSFGDFVVCQINKKRAMGVVISTQNGILGIETGFNNPIYQRAQFAEVGWLQRLYVPLNDHEIKQLRKMMIAVGEKTARLGWQDGTANNEAYLCFSKWLEDKDSVTIESQLGFFQRLFRKIDK